jgi:glycosyltransferase involved in cell wall biosynthesis
MGKIKIVHYQRLRRPGANYSLEFIFEDLRQRLGRKLTIELVNAPCLSKGFFRRLLIAFHAWLRQGDITHITGDITFAGLLLNPSKTVITILDCGILHRKRGIARWLIKKFWFEWPMSRCRWVTTISRSAAEDVAKQCSVDLSKIRVIPVAISESFQHSQKIFNQSCPRILQIGTAPNKNLHRLIEALEGISCTLVIIGRITESIRTSLAERNISFENYHSLSNEDVIEEYRKADMLCFVSTYEGFGMPILEAQATGRVVVTSDCYSMPEVAGKGALLADPNSVASIREAIQTVVQNATVRNELIAKGLENSRRFRADEIALQFEKLYDSFS